MEEKCLHDQCPMEARIATLERRVENNERKNSETHKEFYNRVRALETKDAVRNEQYDTILNKLESLTASVGTLAKSLSDIQSEPGKEWKDLKKNIRWAILAAVIAAVMGFLLGKVGL